MNNLPGGTYLNPAFQPSNATPIFQGQAHGQNRFDNTSFRGQKRKYPGDNWKQDQRSDQLVSPHPLKKPENRPKVQVAPAVPSFGSPLFSSKPAVQSTSAPTPRTQVDAQKAKASLGLVPRDEDDFSVSSESEDEGVDEEAAFQAASTGPLTFEFNGEVAKLESQADIKAWIEERKRLWPSRRRIDQKNAEKQARIDERRRIEAETRASASNQQGADRHSQSQRPSTMSVNPQTNAKVDEDEDVQAQSHKETTAPEDLRRQLAESAQTESVPSVQTVDESIQGEQVDNKGGPSADGPNSDFEAESASGSDDDSAPEVESSKASAQVSAMPKRPAGVCRMFASSGRCKFGDRCHYQHVGTPRAEAQGQSQRNQKGPASTARKTLFDKACISVIHGMNFYS